MVPLGAFDGRDHTAAAPPGNRVRSCVRREKTSAKRRSIVDFNAKTTKQQIQD